MTISRQRQAAGSDGINVRGEEFRFRQKGLFRNANACLRPAGEDPAGICFGRLGGRAERTVARSDGPEHPPWRSVHRGRTSGKGRKLVNRYDETAFICPERGTPGKRGISFGDEKAVDLQVDLSSLEPGKKFTPAWARRLSVKGDAEVFDADGLRLPLAVTPLAGRGPDPAVRAPQDARTAKRR